MRPNSPINIRLSISTLLLLVFSGFSTLDAVDRQLQFSTYYDSNVGEASTTPEPTFGFTLRGRLNHEIERPRLSIFGEILSQVNLDAVFRDESKLITSADLDLRYALSRNLYVLGSLEHFQKSFASRTGSYCWTEYSTFLHYSPETFYSSWLGYRNRRKTLEATNRYRFTEHNLELGGRYDFNQRIYLEGTLAAISIIYSDFYAMGVVEDASLILLDYPQKDRGVNGLLHLRYQGKAIIGAQIGIGAIESNSAIGKFNRFSYRVYFTGKLGPAIFYHTVFHRIYKRYRYPGLESENRYRDPEEPTQNLLHLRLERVLGDRGIGYLQFSLLENETIFNQRYYNKTLIEFGVKYDF